MNKKNSFIKVILLLFMLVLYGCPLDKGWLISFHNNSQQTVCLYAKYIFPDTLLPSAKPELIQIEERTNGVIYDTYINDPEFKRLEKEGGILTVFVLSKDTVDKYDWSEIRLKNKVLKRYEFDNKELIEMGGGLTYP
jgi:hypothetical protein